MIVYQLKVTVPEEPPREYLTSLGAIPETAAVIAYRTKCESLAQRKEPWIVELQAVTSVTLMKATVGG